MHTHRIDHVVDRWGLIVAVVLTALTLLLGMASWAGAQPVTNPTKVIFTASADHALVDAYTLGYFAVGAPAPTQQATIAKGDLTQVGPDYQFTFPRLLFGTYVVKLRACAATSCSEWAEADRQAAILPFPPVAPRVVP